MVSSRLKRDRQSEEYAITFVQDRGSFPMHQTISPNDLSPVYLADALMSQADPQYGNARSKMANKLVADSSFVGRSRSWRNANFFRVQQLNFFDRRAIIPSNDQFRAEFSKVLNKVVSERIVIVEDQNHKICSARSMARKVAIALFTLSWYSSSGSESATTPPPACT